VRGVLIDAGPLVALIDRSDPHHAACLKTLKAVRDPLLTVWPAVTEAMYLLGFAWTAQESLWEMLECSAINLLPLDRDDHHRMRELMEKYQDLPMDLADAALVCVAEREKLKRVFTLDRKDFGVYRPVGVGRFTLLP